MAALSLLQTVSFSKSSLSSSGNSMEKMGTLSNLPNGHSKIPLLISPRSCSRQFFIPRASFSSSSEKFLKKEETLSNFSDGHSKNPIFGSPRSCYRQFYTPRASFSSNSEKFLKKEESLFNFSDGHSKYPIFGSPRSCSRQFYSPRASFSSNSEKFMKKEETSFNLSNGHSKIPTFSSPRPCSRQFFIPRASFSSYFEKFMKKEQTLSNFSDGHSKIPFFNSPRSTSHEKIMNKESNLSSQISARSTSPFSSEKITETEAKSETSFLQKALTLLENLKKPALLVLFIGILLSVDPSLALAASGGRMGGRSFSSSSPSFSSSRSYSVSPGSSFSYSAPYYYAPSPFFGGGGGLYFGFGAGSGFFLLLMGFAAVILVSGFLTDRSDDGSVLTATEKTSVLKLQVGLLGLARSFQRDLDKIADAADTSTPAGLSYVLTETTLALLRHPDCCISGYSLVDIKRSVEGGEKRFNELSIEERGKFDEETLVNVNSIKRRSVGSSRSSTFSNEYIVITILVAAEGVHKLPVINGSSNLREALQQLASIPSNRLMAVEVLWTPQNEGDTLSERELLEDYPLLRPL